MSLEKRSMSIAGHRSSLALEPEFWAAFERAAVELGETIPALAADIDAGRDPERSLASAIRVWLLQRKPGG